ncbi:MAG: hypothetical protein IAG13_29095 [Deltaproteobacteria bacterium]|nr:hypothetical protein [Nannocystaceae bacterium]
MATLGVILAAVNARAGKPDDRVGVVLLERTLLDPPRLPAMTRWTAAVHRRFPQAERLAYVWHLVSHAREDGLRARASRRPAGDDQEFGGLQPSVAVTRAWEVSKMCAQVSGSSRVVLRTGTSLTPGALGRKRMREFVAARRAEGFSIVWEPEGLWDDELAVAFARELDVTLLVPAFAGGRPRRVNETSNVIVDARAWLRIDGVGSRGGLDAHHIDALVEHAEQVPDATFVFSGPRALRHVGMLATELAG